MNIIDNINTLLDSIEDTTATNTEIGSMNQLISSFSDIIRGNMKDEFSINDLNNILDSFGMVLTKTQKVVLSKNAMITTFESRNKIEELLEDFTKDLEMKSDKDEKTEKNRQNDYKKLEKDLKKKDKWEKYKCKKTDLIPSNGKPSKIDCEKKGDVIKHISSVQMSDVSTDDANTEDTVFDIFANSRNELSILPSKNLKVQTFTPLKK